MTNDADQKWQQKRDELADDYDYSHLSHVTAYKDGYSDCRAEMQSEINWYKENAIRLEKIDNELNQKRLDEVTKLINQLAAKQAEVDELKLQIKELENYKFMYESCSK